MKTLSQNEIAAAKQKILSSIKQFEDKKILVVGDLGIDEYLSGEVRRISPEAPVPVVEVKSREYRVGLAANVAQNLQSLGGLGLIVGLIGSDSAAIELRKLLKQNGVSDQHLAVDEQRPTTRKVRVMSGQHHVVRVDFENKTFIDNQQIDHMLAKIEPLLPQCKGVIIQDYGKGVVSEKFSQGVIARAHQSGCKVVVDPHRTTPVRYYRGADLIKPNRDEAFVISGLNIDDLHINEKSLDKVAHAIQEQTHCPQLIVTQGSKGVSYYNGQSVTHIPTVPRQVFDVTGAGDTYVAAFSLAWFSGLDAVTSAIMANYAAGVVVGKIGCVPCSKDELIAAMAEH